MRAWSTEDAPATGTDHGEGTVSLVEEEHSTGRSLPSWGHHRGREIRGGRLTCR